MEKNTYQEPAITEFEKRAQSLISLMFDLCEAKIRKNRTMPAHELAALTSSALALQNSIASFRAIAKLSE